MGSKKKPAPRIKPGNAAARSRLDIISVSFPADTITDLDSCCAELTRRGDLKGNPSRSAVIRYAIAMLHDRLFWRDGKEQATSEEVNQ